MNSYLLNNILVTYFHLFLLFLLYLLYLLNILKEYGIYTHIKKFQISPNNINAREILLFLTVLFQNMQHFNPKDTIVFSCILGDSLVKIISLMNPTKKTLEYSVKYEGSECFSINNQGPKIEKQIEDAYDQYNYQRDKNRPIIERRMKQKKDLFDFIKKKVIEYYKKMEKRLTEDKKGVESINLFLNNLYKEMSRNHREATKKGRK